MGSQHRLADIRDKLVVAGFIFVVGTASGAGWYWTSGLMDRPTKSEVRQMIKDEVINKAEVKDLISSNAPYIHDRKLIMESVNRGNKTEEKLAAVITELKIAITELKMAISKD